MEDALAGLELSMFELGEAFKGLKDVNVWKRPAPGLLSIGEQAGHMAYWEAVRLASDGTDNSDRPDLSSCKVKSPLIDEGFRYYTTSVKSPPPDDCLKMTADQVWAELQRVHKQSIAHFKALNPDLDSPAPWWHSTYRDYLLYAAFHTAYHTGQIYSVRHLLGETPPDN